MITRNKILIFVTVGFLAFLAAIFWRNSVFFKPKIGFNFLLRPYFQSAPRVFINGVWKSLPTSQSNILSEDGKQLAVCGEGGVYIYDMPTDNIEYLHSEEWYPCQNILFIDGDTLATEDLEERMIFDINERKLLKKEPVSEDEVLARYAEYFNTRKTEFKEVCNEKSICAKLNDDKTVIVLDKHGGAKNTNITRAVALVGFKGSVLFYATYEGTCVIPASNKIGILVNPAYACIINHHLYAYNIDKRVSEGILTNFRYDYEMMVFFK